MTARGRAPSRAHDRNQEARVEIPEKLRYTASHEWVEDHGDGTASVGITAHATEQLGELVYVELPKPGAKLVRGAACAVVESTKAASDVYAPVSGEVLAVNEGLADAPQQVNSAPYAGGWLFKLKLGDRGELGSLLDAQSYKRSAS
jgi:glycine cleavage system H protein